MRKNYIPGSMGFAEGFISLNYLTKDKGFWMEVAPTKARKIIKKLLKKGRKITHAELGLDGDWAENSCGIYDGKRFYTYDAYEGSRWATPILIVNFEDGPSETYECYTRGEK